MIGGAADTGPPTTTPADAIAALSSAVSTSPRNLARTTTAQFSIDAQRKTNDASMKTLESLSEIAPCNNLQRNFLIPSAQIVRTAVDGAQTKLLG